MRNKLMGNKLIGFLLMMSIMLAGCNPSADSKVQADRLIVAAGSVIPHGEILEEVVKPLLAEKGITLQVRVIHGAEINDFLLQKQIDANFFQHVPYLDSYNADRKANLVNIIGVHIEPFGAYSNRYQQLADLPDGAEIVIPNDPSNHSRALVLLDRAGIIQVRDPGNPLTGLHDIIANPKHFKFREMDTALMNRILDQVDLALINSNYVLSAGMNPVRDALVMEGPDSPYVNILVTRPEDQNDARIKALAQALTSAEVKTFIQQRYPGAVVPAF